MHWHVRSLNRLTTPDKILEESKRILSWSTVLRLAWKRGLHEAANQLQAVVWCIAIQSSSLLCRFSSIIVVQGHSLCGTLCRFVVQAHKKAKWRPVCPAVRRVLRISSLAYLSLADSSLGLQIDQDLQRDGLHPTLQGLAVLAACILPAVESILGPGNRPPNFLDNHPLPLRLWIRDQAASGSFWNN